MVRLPPPTTPQRVPLLLHPPTWPRSCRHGRPFFRHISTVVNYTTPVGPYGRGVWSSQNLVPLWSQPLSAGIKCGRPLVIHSSPAPPRWRLCSSDMTNEPSSEAHDRGFHPSSAHPGASLYRTITPTGSRAYPAQTLLSSTNQASQQLDSSMARAYRITPPDNSPSSLGNYRQHAEPSPHRFNTNLPDKRPRLLSSAENHPSDLGDGIESSADQNVCLWPGNLLAPHDLTLTCRTSTDTCNNVRAPDPRICSPSWVVCLRMWTARASIVPPQDI